MGSYGRMWGHVAGSEVVVGGQAYSIEGEMWQGWQGMVRCGGMLQGVWACGRVCGRVWGHVPGFRLCGRGSGLWHGWGHVVGLGACGRVWGHVAGCGGMWQGWWQGVEAYGSGGDMWQGVRPMAQMGTCGRGGDIW